MSLQTRLAALITAIGADIKAAPLRAWPIGSIFLSVDPTNPNTLLGGGTWVAWGAGRVPTGYDLSQPEFNPVELSGGSIDMMLAEYHIPSHTHAVDHNHPSVTTALFGDHTHDVTRKTGVGTNTGTARGNATNDSSSVTSMEGNHTHTVDLPNYVGASGPYGGGAPHDIMQPYIVCYMWKRTA